MLLNCSILIQLSLLINISVKKTTMYTLNQHTDMHSEHLGYFIHFNIYPQLKQLVSLTKSQIAKRSFRKRYRSCLFSLFLWQKLQLFQTGPKPFPIARNFLFGFAKCNQNRLGQIQSIWNKCISTICIKSNFCHNGVVKPYNTK